MKIIRHYVTGSDDDRGDGFIPLWVPGASNFDPGSPALMVHDMLEHRLCDSGFFHEEIMAVGRVIALRVVPGYGGAKPSVAGLAQENASIWCNDGDHYIAHAPKTKPLTEVGVEQFVQEFADLTLEYIRDELSYILDDQTLPTRRLHAALVGWTRIGYMDAIRRYGPQDHGCFEVGRAAFDWANKSYNAHRFEDFATDWTDQRGAVTLEFDTKTLQMTERFYMRGEENDFPAWLHDRVAKWARATSPQLPIPYFVQT